MKFLCAAFLAELRGELKPLSGQCLFILMFRVLRRCPKTQNVQMSKPGPSLSTRSKSPAMIYDDDVREKNARIALRRHGEELLLDSGEGPK